MAEIPRSLLDGLASEVAALAGAATSQAESALWRVVDAWDGSDVAALRNAAVQVLQAVVPAYSDLSAARAAEFYEISRQLQGAAGSYRATVLSGHLAEADEQAVRALLQSVVEGGGTDALVSELLDRVDAEIRRSANRCVALNASRDPASPSYALVPSGSETCGFCLMIASFGPRYTGSFRAHANCDCRLVADFGGAYVAGYDPGGMYGRYLECLETLGGRNGVGAGWEALSAEERAAYVGRHGGKDGEAFQAYLDKRVAAEIETRDAGWYQGSSGCSVTVEEGAKPKLKERELASSLTAHGFNVSFIKPAGVAGSRTADAYLNGTRWEFKQPVGNRKAQTIGENTIDHQFEEAVGQSRNIVLDFRVIEGYPSVDTEKTCEKAASLLRGKWSPEFDQVLVAGNGWLLRYEKA